MTVKQNIRNALNAGLDALNSGLKHLDYRIMPGRQLYDWQMRPEPPPSYNHSLLPAGAADYLRLDNAVLEDLRARYTAFDSRATTPLVWTDERVKPEDIQYFRGDNAYVYQLRGRNMNVMAYALTALYVKSIDALGLLDTLKEDSLFGNYTFDIDGRPVSRDLLDSIMEIYFLEKHLGLSRGHGRTVLDIGAGYGRLAHRMTGALPNLGSYLCTDAVAVSSFISEYYLRVRGAQDRTRVVPLDEIESTLGANPVELAINIHSFSECRIEAVGWWLSLLQKHGVRYLMVVPNAGNHGGERLLTHDGSDFGDVIEKHGYRLIAKEPKYRDATVHEFAINPTYHYLFELQ